MEIWVAVLITVLVIAFSEAVEALEETWVWELAVEEWETLVE